MVLTFTKVYVYVHIIGLICLCWHTAICFSFNNINYLCVVREDYRATRYVVRFEKGGSRYGELTTTRIDDEYVEDDEYYYLKIQTGLLPNDVVIDGPDTAKIILVNEDGKYNL